MISGAKAEGNRLLAWSLYALLSFTPIAAWAQATADAELSQVMSALSSVRTAEGRFTERKYLSILSEPLVSEGTVRYRSPDYVRKEYDDPESETYEVRGDNLTIELPDGRRRDLSIDEHPVLRAFVESYRGTLAGDVETLSRYFALTLTGTMDDWSLTLTPRQAELAEHLSAVVMQGSGGRVLRVETLEASGDRSVMTVDAAGE
jgi:outer membrane lipoprotein-sorting protein